MIACIWKEKQYWWDMDTQTRFQDGSSRIGIKRTAWRSAESAVKPSPSNECSKLRCKQQTEHPSETYFHRLDEESSSLGQKGHSDPNLGLSPSKLEQRRSLCSSTSNFVKHVPEGSISRKQQSMTCMSLKHLRVHKIDLQFPSMHKMGEKQEYNSIWYRNKKILAKLYCLCKEFVESVSDLCTIVHQRNNHPDNATGMERTQPRYLGPLQKWKEKSTTHSSR